AVVFTLEQPRELSDAIAAVFLLAHAFGAAEMVRKRQEIGALAEMAVASAIAVGRRDGRRAERAAMIAALEGEHQALAILGVADALEAVLDRLDASHVEVNTPLLVELLLGIARNHRGQLNLLAMQVLARNLRQGVELPFDGIVQPGITIAEVDG